MTHHDWPRLPTPTRPPGGIALHIESLVLHGVRPGDRYRIGDAFERELARLLGERIPASLREGASQPDLNAGQIALETGSLPEAIGERIARAVYAGLDTVPDPVHGDGSVRKSFRPYRR